MDVYTDAEVIRKYRTESVKEFGITGIFYRFFFMMYVRIIVEALDFQELFFIQTLKNNYIIIKI